MNFIEGSHQRRTGNPILGEWDSYFLAGTHFVIINLFSRGNKTALHKNPPGRQHSFVEI